MHSSVADVAAGIDDGDSGGVRVQSPPPILGPEMTERPNLPLSAQSQSVRPGSTRASGVPVWRARRSRAVRRQDSRVSTPARPRARSNAGLRPQPPGRAGSGLGRRCGPPASIPVALAVARPSHRRRLTHPSRKPAQPGHPGRSRPQHGKMQRLVNKNFLPSQSLSAVTAHRPTDERRHLDFVYVS